MKIGDEARRRFLQQFITENCVKVGGPFKLASGRESDFYVDCKPAMLTSHPAAALTQLMFRALLKRWPGLDAVAGPAVGAVPLVALAVLAGDEAARPWSGYIVRIDKKDHGTATLIDGPPVQEGIKVVLLEDVVTTGGSGLLAVKYLRKAGMHVIGALCIVDREEGGKEAFAEQDIELMSLFTKADFVS